jgi:hypothetical protein
MKFQLFLRWISVQMFRNSCSCIILVFCYRKPGVRICRWRRVWLFPHTHAVYRLPRIFISKLLVNLSWQLPSRNVVKKRCKGHVEPPPHVSTMVSRGPALGVSKWALPRLPRRDPYWYKGHFHWVSRCLHHRRRWSPRSVQICSLRHINLQHVHFLCARENAGSWKQDGPFPMIINILCHFLQRFLPYLSPA